MHGLDAETALSGPGSAALAKPAAARNADKLTGPSSPYQQLCCLICLDRILHLPELNQAPFASAAFSSAAKLLLLRTAADMDSTQRSAQAHCLCRSLACGFSVHSSCNQASVSLACIRCRKRGLTACCGGVQHATATVRFSAKTTPLMDVSLYGRNSGAIQV